MKHLLIYTVIACSSVKAFTLILPSTRGTSCRSSSFNPTNAQAQPFFRLYNEEKDDAERTGMDEAFASLNELGPPDLGTPAKSSESKLNLDTDIGTSSSDEMADNGDMSPDEIKLYKEMYTEVDKDEVGEIYEDILGELSGEQVSKPASSSSMAGKGFGKTPAGTLDDADGIGAINDNDLEQLTAVELSQDTDEFMRKALQEALDEAKLQTKSTTIDESLLNDKELMKEINAVFDKANDQLMAGVADIKKEQAEFTKASSEKRSKALQEEEARLIVAAGSVTRLVDKVKEETMEVQKAVDELKDAQEKMGDDPLSQAAELKKAGIVRQSALVGALLFSFRSIGELIAVAQASGDVEGHGAAAAIQAFIALACGGYLVFF